MSTQTPKLSSSLPNSSDVINSIRAKLEKQNKQKKNDESSKYKWSPKENEQYTVRIVPYIHAVDPFIDLFFHYDLPGRPLCPKHSKPEEENRCAICEFAEELAKQAKKAKAKGDLNNEYWKQFKKISAKKRTYTPVIIRGKEDEGAKFWGLSEKTYNAIASYFIKPGWGNLSDPIEGRDFEVVARKAAGQKYAEPQVSPAPDKTRLIFTSEENLKKDNTKAAEIIKNVPNVFDVFPLTDYETTKKALDELLSQSDDDTQEEDVTENLTETTLNEEESQHPETQESSNNDADIDDLLERLK